MCYFVILITPFLIITLYYYYVYFNTKNRLKNVPKISPNLSSDHICDDFLIKYPKIYGKSFWVMLGFKPILFSCDKKLIEVILSSEKHSNKPEVGKFLRKNGLIAANDNIWKNHRKILTPSFHRNQFDPNHLINESNRLVDDLKQHLNEDSFEFVSKAKLWSFRLSSETLLGIKSDLILMYKEKFEDLIKIISNRIFNPWEYFDWTYYFTKNFWREKRLIRILDKFFLEIIEEKIKTFREESPKTPLNLMIKELIEKRWSLRDVLDEIYSILYASYEPTALTLSYIIFNLANHPEMQEKVYNEIKNESNLDQLKYLDLFIKESMRSYTVIGVLPRKLGEDVKWGELTLPKGLIVVFPMQAVHNDPEIYPEPSKTIPERFCGKKSNLYVFGGGRRDCIGSKYAMMALKTCLCKLLLNYKFVSVGHRLQRVARDVVVSKNGVMIKVEKRN